MLYIDIEIVKRELVGKVKLEGVTLPDDPYYDNESYGMTLSNAEILEYMADSQGEVEMDLYQIYQIPLEDENGATQFSGFSSQTTVAILTNLFKWRAVSYILMVFYSKTETIDENKLGYVESSDAIYQRFLDKATKRWDRDDGAGFVYPALPGLKVSGKYTTRENRGFIASVPSSMVSSNTVTTIKNVTKMMPNPAKGWWW